MKKIKINEIEFEIIKDNNDAIDIEEISGKLTDYFDEYNYIVGDWAYGKLRLKGFYDDDNKKSNQMNKISNVNNYIDTYCAYGCKYFILKKI